MPPKPRITILLFLLSAALFFALLVARPAAAVFTDILQEQGVSNDRVLVGISTNVFVAKVLQEVGSEPYLGHPYTQFQAEVLFNIEGDLRGNVIIAQKHSEEAPPLQPGATYVFAAIALNQKPWYQVALYPEHYRMITDRNLGNGVLKDMASVNPRVIALERACPFQVAMEDRPRRRCHFESPSMFYIVLGNWTGVAALLTASLAVFCIAWLNPRKKKPTHNPPTP